MMPPVVGREKVLGLDILRSVAILLVVLSHYANNMALWCGITLPQKIFFLGELGVDMFFALSGFLIGRILIDIVAHAPTRRDLVVFLVRRWMRTVPAYVFWLCILAVFFPPATGLVGHLVHFATFTQNLLQPMPSDNWFAVSWSLTVEEWFYLLFGGCAIITAILVRRSWAIWVPLAVILVIPLIARLCVPVKDYFDAGYYKMVPFRLDEIGYGVVFAWLYTRRSWIFSTHPLPLFMVGLGFIAASWFALLPIPFALYVALRNTMAVLGCALCIPIALRIRTAPAWLQGPARTVSRLSYSLYLVHETLLVDVAQGLWWQKRISTAGAILVSSLGAMLIADMMSRWIEQPVMRRRPRQFRATIPQPSPALPVAGAY